jgi:hypothetical protein
MKRQTSFCCIGFVALGLSGPGFAQTAASPKPLVQAHAHNDYAHARPLLDALDHGFCSVEADIHLVDGQILVAHDREQTKPDRTLQALYLDPLRERVRKNGGRVIPNGPEQTLLIDLKSDWRTLYPALRAVVTNYADMLTTFRDGKKQTNAVLLLLTGNHSPDMFASEAVRYAALDGELNDLDSDASPNLVPWISTPWGKTFKWRGEGTIPAEELARLKEMVTKAHQRGRRIRFWGAPDKPVFWSTMRTAGVDLINTDNLSGLETFLRDIRLFAP